MKALTILILFLLLLVIPFKAFAQNIKQGDNVVLTKNEVINKDYFAAGNSVTIEGTVNGDAYIAGGNIVINGTVNGDLLTAGGNLDIRGNITGNVRAAGGNININGTVGRNVTLAGGSINLSSNANINGSLTAAGGNLAIYSPIEKDINLAGGQVTIGNRVGGDINSAVGQLSLTQTATVSGNLTYLSKNSASISQDATVSGKITQNIPQDKQITEPAKKGILALFSFLKIASFILVAIVGLLLIRFFPIFLTRVSGLIIGRPWTSMGIGFLTVVAFPFIFILLLVTVIGIPIAFFLAFILGVYFYLAKIFISFVIGQLIFGRFSKNTNKVWPYLLGLVIYYLLATVPILGWFISVIAGLTGVGAILVAKKNYYLDLRDKKLI